MKNYIFNFKNSKIAIKAKDMDEAKLVYIKILVEREGLMIFGYENDNILEDNSVTEVWETSDWIVSNEHSVLKLGGVNMKEYLIFWADYKDMSYDKNVSIYSSLQVATREADKMHEADKEQFHHNQYAVYEFKNKEIVKKVYETN